MWRKRRAKHFEHQSQKWYRSGTLYRWRAVHCIRLLDWKRTTHNESTLEMKLNVLITNCRWELAKASASFQRMEFFACPLSTMCFENSSENHYDTFRNQKLRIDCDVMDCKWTENISIQLVCCKFHDLCFIARTGTNASLTILWRDKNAFNFYVSPADRHIM